MDNFLFFCREGIVHVLDKNAYDHALFLIVLTIVYDFNHLKKVLWLISLFTIGHTISLFLATYNVLVINPNWIEFLIPLTIIVTGIANVIVYKNVDRENKKNTNLIFAVFFGIIHGFGFAGGFKMLIGSIKAKFIPLLEFALGIEISQIIIVFAILLIGLIFQGFFRFSKRDWVLVVSALVIGAALPMLKDAIFW